jgi:hypothetical protein
MTLSRCLGFEDQNHAFDEIDGYDRKCCYLDASFEIFSGFRELDFVLSQSYDNFIALVMSFECMKLYYPTLVESFEYKKLCFARKIYFNVHLAKTLILYLCYHHLL